MVSLPRTAWAWEWLRRSPQYRAEWDRRRERGTQSLLLKPGSRWPLVRFEDPAHDSRAATVFWRREVCREVLPLAASTAFTRHDPEYFRLDGLQCRVATLPEPEFDRLHVLFADEGRLLQIQICGATHFEGGVLLTPVLPPPHLRPARTQALLRLNDLMAHGTLRSSLYTAEARNVRMVRVVRALDGALAGVPHRDIALSLFGEKRVAEEWHGTSNALRDHVRRAIGHGRELVDGGYMRLLR